MLGMERRKLVPSQSPLPVICARPMLLSISWFKCVWAGPVDLRMPSLCHSWLIAIGETIAARASGFFNRIKFATFATLTRRKLPQFQVATFGKTQGGQHPTTNIIFNIATQHLTKKLSHKIRRGMRPFQNTMRNITLHKRVYFNLRTLSTTAGVKMCKIQPSTVIATLAHPKLTTTCFNQQLIEG